MKKENKKTNLKRSEKITTAVLACLLIGGVAAIGGKVYHDSTKKEPGVIETIPGDEDVSIKQNGITIKKLNSVTNQDGSVTKTFTYTISPANATNKAISASAKYSDGTACTDVVTVSTNTSNQTISITCKKEFGKVINVTITSLANSSATATIKLNYTKKLKSITGIQKEYIIQNVNNTVVSINDLFTPNYSLYTKDKSYTFRYYDGTVDAERYKTDGGYVDNYKFSDGTFLDDKLSNLIIEAVRGQSALPTASDIWNLDSSNAYHSWLVSTTKKEKESDHIAKYIFSFGVECVETGQTISSGENTGFVTFDFSTFDYSAKTVGVDSLASELTSIDF